MNAGEQVGASPTEIAAAFKVVWRACVPRFHLQIVIATKIAQPDANVNLASAFQTGDVVVITTVHRLKFALSEIVCPILTYVEMMGAVPTTKSV